jgi:protein-ribulosamine 3-kinase
MAAAGHFGFPVDNSIGGTPQPNGWSAGTGTAGWVEFWAERRLRHMLGLAGGWAGGRAGGRAGGCCG